MLLTMLSRVTRGIRETCIYKRGIMRLERRIFHLLLINSYSRRHLTRWHDISNASRRAAPPPLSFLSPSIEFSILRSVQLGNFSLDSSDNNVNLKFIGIFIIVNAVLYSYLPTCLLFFGYFEMFCKHMQRWVIKYIGLYILFICFRRQYRTRR